MEADSGYLLSVAASLAQIAENTRNQQGMTIEPFLNQIMRQGSQLGNLQGNQIIPNVNQNQSPFFNFG